MGWRFRRSVKIAPGVRLNFGKSGFTSWSIGGRGNRLTVGKRGTTHTVGLPGTGLSYSRRAAGGGRSSAWASESGDAPSFAEAVPARFGIERPIAPRNRVRTVALSVAVVMLVLMFMPGFYLFVTPLGVAMVIALVVAAMAPSRGGVQRQLDVAHSEAVGAEVSRRREQFRQAMLAAAETDSSAALRQLDSLRQSLELEEAEVGEGTMEQINAVADLTDFIAAAQANGNKLTSLRGHEPVVGDAVCFFSAEGVVYDKRGDNDPIGRLLLTDKGVTFHAPEGLTSVAWAKTASVTRDERNLLVQRRDRQTPHVFILGSYRDAFIGGWVAEHLWKRVVE